MSLFSLGAEDVTEEQQQFKNKLSDRGIFTLGFADFSALPQTVKSLPNRPSSSD